jgi:hypothetical protein
VPDAKPRDRWDKLQILLDPIGKALTALLVVLLGYIVNDALQRDQKRRAYVELINQRELADSNLRKDMFVKVIEQFIDPGDSTLENRILNLELLVYNFHESIDLGPLLKEIYVQSSSDKTATPRQRRRLQSLAQEIVGREMLVLKEGGCWTQVQVNFDDLEEKFVQPGLIRFECPDRAGLPGRRFVADVMTNPAATDLRMQTEFDVVLRAAPPEATKSHEQRQAFEFTVSPFDFPLIDNVRLGSGGGRVSIVMPRVDDGGVTLALLYFPETLTSLRDKPFQEELLRELEQQ